MADEPDDGEEDEQSFETEEDWGGRDKHPSNPRVELVFVFLACGIIAYVAWAFFGLCSIFFGHSVYIPLISDGGHWLTWVIVGFAIFTAIFLPLDDE